MKISFVLFGLVLLSLCATSCDNASRDARKTWDSSPVQEIAHSGKFKGYAVVYTIDWLNDQPTSSDKTYRIYEKGNGDFIIDYEGENYILSEANPPYGEGVYALKWKFDYNHYIERIPTSY